MRWANALREHDALIHLLEVFPASSALVVFFLMTVRFVMTWSASVRDHSEGLAISLTSNEASPDQMKSLGQEMQHPGARRALLGRLGARL